MIFPATREEDINISIGSETIIESRKVVRKELFNEIYDLVSAVKIRAYKLSLDTSIPAGYVF